MFPLYLKKRSDPWGRQITLKMKQRFYLQYPPQEMKLHSASTMTIGEMYLCRLQPSEPFPQKCRSFCWDRVPRAGAPDLHHEAKHTHLEWRTKPVQSLLVWRQTNRWSLPLLYSLCPEFFPYRTCHMHLWWNPPPIRLSCVAPQQKNVPLSKLRCTNLIKTMKCVGCRWSEFWQVLKFSRDNFQRSTTHLSVAKTVCFLGLIWVSSAMRGLTHWENGAFGARKSFTIGWNNWNYL